MAISLSPLQARKLRLRAQHLHARSESGVDEVVLGLCGVQVQDAQAAALAVRARAGGTAADVERARAERRSIVRTWAMRGTIHLMAAEDARRLLPLVGPPAIRATRRRYAELGLDEEVCSRAVSAVGRALEDHGPMTRAGVSSYLSKVGLPAQGQAPYHILRRAALEGVICFGPNMDGTPSYSLVDALVSASQDGADGLLQGLAIRYLRAYGPADQADFAAWSGLTMKQARAAFEMAADDIDEVDVSGSRWWMPRGRAEWLEEQPGDEPVVRLLPAFDPYLLGYRSRDLGVSGELAWRIHPGGGVIRPALLVDGRAAGTWSLRRAKGGASIVVNPFEALSGLTEENIDREAADIGRFLGMEADVKIEGGNSIPGGIGGRH